MKGSFHIKTGRVLYGLMGALMAVLLIYLLMTPNIEVYQSRELEGYETVTGVSCQKKEDPSAAAGVIREFSFFLDDQVTHDSTLVFEFSHQNAKVYLDGEQVYSLSTARELTMVKTPGANWAMIPLYREDMGKEVRVVLEPVYKNYQDQKIEFFIGSRLAIYTAQFAQSLPEMVLSLIDILAGLILLCVALYFSVKKARGSGFYSLALLAISLGLWNFTQTDFAPFLLSGKTIFIYYISLTMLMVCVVPLNRSAEAPEHQLMGRLLELWRLLCSAASILQLGAQLMGIWDLREMLKITHGMIVVCSLVLIINGFSQLLGQGSGKSQKKRQSHGLWLLGIGALMDMVIYYVRGSSSGLLFVLIAILCYVLMEGMQMFFSYVRQKQMLEEKETQLTLSRITTMMSQIRSHFVFNILNAISGMCKYDPEKADETVVRFARYLRNNIDIMEDDKPVLFSTELAHLEDYVVLEQVRFGDKIEFCTQVRTQQFMMPPLILQPVVENAIKHGLTKKQSGGTVTLRTWEEDGNVKIAVEDDGVGFEPSELEKKESVGLKNISYRLEHLVKGSLDIKSQVGTGTQVTITIPKEEAKLCE